MHLPVLIVVFLLALLIFGPRTIRQRSNGCALVVLGVVGIFTVALVAAANVTGTWEVESTFDGSSVSEGGFDCAFKQDGERLTGACSGGTAPLTGEVKGQNVTWQIKAGRTQETITFTGIVDEAGTSMKGRFSMAEKGGHFTALKQ
jgi:hypothetical protein